MKMKKIITIILVNSLISTISLNDLCISIEDLYYEQTEQNRKYKENQEENEIPDNNYDNLMNSFEGDPIGAGNFGEVRILLYNKIESVVKIQRFHYFDYGNSNFNAALLEINTLKMFKDDIDLIHRIREYKKKISDAGFFDENNEENSNYYNYEVRKSYGVIEEDVYDFLDKIINLKKDFIRMPRNIFNNEFGYKFDMNVFDFENEIDFEEGFTKTFLLKYFNINGEHILDKFSSILSKTLQDMMILKYYQCIYDNARKEIYIVIEKLADTWENQIPNFLTNFEESIRINHYLYLMTDIRKLHTQYKLVHMDIKPDNIMVNEKFEKGKRQQRLKLIDYGLMGKIGSPINNFFKKYAHPSLINKTIYELQPFMDIYCFLLAIAVVEYGEDSIILKNDNCYNVYYSIDCFEQLKKQIILRFCEKLEENNQEFLTCKDKYDMSNNYRPDPYTECFDLLCYIISNIQYDQNEMMEKLNREEDWKYRNFNSEVYTHEMAYSLVFLRNQVFGGFLYNNRLESIRFDDNSFLGVKIKILV